jgi:hypothetical protein
VEGIVRSTEIVLIEILFEVVEDDDDVESEKVTALTTGPVDDGLTPLATYAERVRVVAVNGEGGGSFDLIGANSGQLGLI